MIYGPGGSGFISRFHSPIVSGSNSPGALLGVLGDDAKQRYGDAVPTS